MMSNEDLFKKIENKSGVNMNEIFKLAQSIQGANFQDEKTLRDIIRKVAALANRNVSKEQEDQLVHVILKNSHSMNMQQLAKMMDKN